MTSVRFAFASVVAFAVSTSSVASAQARKIRVVSTDSEPISFAYVSVQGGIGQITDEQGEVSLGAGKRQTLTVNVRRIGFQPWFGKLELPDTASVLTVVLARVAQGLSAVRVTGSAPAPSAALKGFYDRWMMRQKGTLSAVFIGPEEIEFRHPNKITNMLSGLVGVMLKRGTRGFLEAYNAAGTCRMAVLLDGNRQCPRFGCDVAPVTATPCPTNVFNGRYPPGCDPDDQAVFIDQLVDANDVTAIEVYARGGNVPSSLSVSDQACGIIALWTGSRKP
ncbi:MAG: hypothetical protein ACREN6_05700 [Gemmatimonadaceae bacterium]